jgi:prolyl-tRNA synthetase family I
MELSVTSKKNEDFNDWYRQSITKTNLIKYYDVSGCYVLLPLSYSIWENIQKKIDSEIKKMGVENCYFPLFVTEENLRKEKDHLAGFEPEVAWINKTGSEDAVNKIAIRPTSECIICPIVSEMIRSHTQLPMKLNQWCNVVRWEFKDPTPFIRSREFLWQEGHTFYADKAEAEKEVLDVTKLYKNIYEDLLGVPVIMGKKTKKETFAGANYTYTVEGFIPETGKGIQCATSHHIGQHFAKIFDIQYQNEKMGMSYVYQNSWGFTTRSIGVMIMTHGDDAGLILPPKVAPIQIIIVPIYKKDNRELLEKYIKDELTDYLDSNYEIKYKVDKTNHRPGWKFNYWEMQGVPLRIEVGENDVKNNTFVLCPRNAKNIEGNKKAKTIISKNELDKIPSVLNNIQNELFESAKEKLYNSIVAVDTMEDMKKTIDNNKMSYSPWCEKIECEDFIKEQTGAKSLCIPCEKIFNASSNKCVVCESTTETYCLFAKSF